MSAQERKERPGWEESESCMCLTDEQEWRPCPESLCERNDHEHPSRDWLVTYARRVALERDYCARHPGHVFLVMLHQDEAEGLLKQVGELVAGGEQ